MGTRAIKQDVLKILKQNNLAEVETELALLGKKEVVNALFSGICHPDEEIRWHAVSIMGQTVAQLADQDMEEARMIIRRMLWSLNDESGGIGWGAPESMAEIMCHHKGITDEYIHMLISYMRPDGEEEWQDGNFLEHEVLQQGLMWAIGRLAQCRREELLDRDVGRDLVSYLESADRMVRGLAARAVGLLGCGEQKEKLQSLAENDCGTVRLYEHGEFHMTSVGKLAAQALQELG